MMRRCAGGLNSCGTCMAMSRVRPERICRHAFWGAKPEVVHDAHDPISRLRSHVGLVVEDPRDGRDRDTAGPAMSTIVVFGARDRTATRHRPPLRTGAGRSSSRSAGRLSSTERRPTRSPSYWTVRMMAGPRRRSAGPSAALMDGDDDLAFRGPCRGSGRPVRRWSGCRAASSHVSSVVANAPALVRVAVTLVLVEREGAISTGVDVHLEGRVTARRRHADGPAPSARSSRPARRPGCARSEHGDLDHLAAREDARRSRGRTSPCRPADGPMRVLGAIVEWTRARDHSGSGGPRGRPGTPARA